MGLAGGTNPHPVGVEARDEPLHLASIAVRCGGDAACDSAAPTIVMASTSTASQQTTVKVMAIERQSANKSGFISS
jgi:hypothetical protein